MEALLTTFVLASPLFLTSAAGFAAVKLLRLPPRLTVWATNLVFSVALPALLFHLMAGFRSLPPPDLRVLAVFFGGCGLVYAAGWLLGLARGWDGASRSVFGVGTVFSNNVMLGLPLARLLLGPEAVPAVSLVLLFNAALLWTLVTVSVEWARSGRPSLANLGRTLGRVALNPIVAAIVAGIAFGLTGWTLPPLVEVPLEAVGNLAGPLALLVLGMGMAEYRLGGEKKLTLGLTAFKLVVHPAVVLLLARLAGLPRLELRTVVLLASCALGSNVYLMARSFGVLEAPVAQALLVSTAAAALTVPLWLVASGL